MPCRRYLLELSLVLGAYVLALAGSLALLAGGIENEALRVAVALSPMLPGLGVCWAVLRQLRRLDELQRRVQLESLGIAFAATGLVTFAYGFLEGIGFPRLSMFAVWPLMAGFWLLALLLGSRRYR